MLCFFGGATGGVTGFLGSSFSGTGFLSGQVIGIILTSFLIFPGDSVEIDPPP